MLNESKLAQEETEDESVFAVLRKEEVVDVWGAFDDAYRSAKVLDADKVVRFAKDENGDYNRPIAIFPVNGKGQPARAVKDDYELAM